MLVESAVTLPIMCGYALACRSTFRRLAQRMRRFIARVDGERTMTVEAVSLAASSGCTGCTKEQNGQNDLVDAILTYVAATFPRFVPHVELKAIYRPAVSPDGAEYARLEIVRMLFLPDAGTRLFLEPANVYISTSRRTGGEGGEKHADRKAHEHHQHRRSVVLRAYGPSAGEHLQQFVDKCVRAATTREIRQHRQS